MSYLAEHVDDHEYQEDILEAVTREGNGYVLKHDGWSLYVDDPGWEMKAGQVARFYGKGIGYAVRGVEIEGRTIYYKTPAEQAAEDKARSEKLQAETTAAKAATKAAGRDEKTLRESQAPWPKSLDELMAYIKGMVEGPHNYGTCVYAMSLSAVAAFNYVWHELGTTGFQASCADLDILRRTRSLDGPFVLLKAEDALYPQYDLRAKLEECREKWGPWLKEQATKKLAEAGPVHPDVAAHWVRLAAEPVPLAATKEKP
jgi:hypothetical protein